MWIINFSRSLKKRSWYLTNLRDWCPNKDSVAVWDQSAGQIRRQIRRSGTWRNSASAGSAAPPCTDRIQRPYAKSAAATPGLCTASACRTRLPRDIPLRCPFWGSSRSPKRKEEARSYLCTLGVVGNILWLVPNICDDFYLHLTKQGYWKICLFILVIPCKPFRIHHCQFFGAHWNHL
jgi:hypothetical protein